MARWKGGWKDKRKGRGRERGKERDGRVGEREESNRLALEITTAVQNRERELLERVHIT